MEKSSSLVLLFWDEARVVSRKESVTALISCTVRARASSGEPENAFKVSSEHLSTAAASGNDGLFAEDGNCWLAWGRERESGRTVLVVLGGRIRWENWL